jgi:plastocyanin
MERRIHPQFPHQKGASVRKLISLSVVAMLAVALTMSSLAFGATKKVGVRGLKFSPKTVTVKKGTTVRWSWKGSVPHNVSGKGFKSKTAGKVTFSRKFSKKGTYKYVCTLHKAQGMTGTVKVR